MLRLRRPPRSFVIFLLLVVAIGAAFGHAVNAAGVAVFFFFIASIEAKPAWKFWFDPPANPKTGRASTRMSSWQRVGASSPKEIRELPSIKKV